MENYLQIKNTAVLLLCVMLFYSEITHECKTLLVFSRLE